MADITHEEKARKAALVEEYSNFLHKRNEQLQKSLSHAQYHFFKNVYMQNTEKVDDSIQNDLLKAMRSPDTVVSEYVSNNLSWLFESAIDKRERDVILYFADRLQEYPYSDSYSRRSFRAKTNGVYGLKLAKLIQRYGFGTIIRDATLDAILNRELPENVLAYLDAYAWNGCGYHGWQVAYALDHHDAKVEETVRRIITEENGSGMMTSELIRGILCSHRKDFHELLGKLLLAARLQEGLRQAICENADYGTRDGFMTILKVIEENHLIRFSSVKRAVGTWLGLVSDETRDLERVSEKSVRLIIDCLENEFTREECLASEDAMKVYIALWSYGFDDIGVATKKVETIAREGSRHQLLVAGYFAANLDLPSVSNKIAKTVICLHHDKEDVLAVWLPSFLHSRVSALWSFDRQHKPIDLHLWFDDEKEVIEHYQIAKQAYAAFSGKSKTFSPCVFPWHEAKLTRSDFAEILCTLAVLSKDTDKIDESCALIKECDSNNRHFYFGALLHAPKTAVQRKAVVEGLIDRGPYTREEAYKIVKGIKLTPEEYGMLEDYLRLKGADIRKWVMELLMRQDDDALSACISRLLDSGKEDIRLGGLDMLLQLKKDERRRALADAFTPKLCARACLDHLPAKEKILLDSLVPVDAKAQTEKIALFTSEDHYLPTEFDQAYIDRCADAFEDYFPDSKLPDLIRGKQKSVLGKIKDALTDQATCKTAITAAEDLLSLSKFIDDHKTVSFQNGHEDILLGNVRYSHQFSGPDGKLPLADLWMEWIKSNGITNRRAVSAMLLFHAYRQKHPMGDACADIIRTVFGAGFEKGRELPYGMMMEKLLDSMCNSISVDKRQQLAAALAYWFIRYVPDDMVMLHVPTRKNLHAQLAMVHLLAHPQLATIYGWLTCQNDGEMKHVFPLAVASAERCVEAYKKVPKAENLLIGSNYYYSANRINYRSLNEPFEPGHRISKSLVGVNAYLLAAYQGIITQAQLYEFLLNPDVLRQSMEVISSVTASLYEKGKLIASRYSYYRSARIANIVKELLGKQDEPNEEDLKLLRFVAKVYETLIPVMIDSELSRGDSPGEYSAGIFGISRIYGADHLAKILSAMGSDTMDRTAYHGWGSASDRRQSLSYLISVCIPAENDSADTLREALEGKKITTKRLIEAALFSPEWIPIVGGYLGIESFEAVCYYFMAHMNEKFDDKRKAMIAKFTPLSEEELNLGAFDVDWFRSASASIGDVEFDLIYDAAKFIADGSKHARARKYADAALGKFDVAELERTVSDKRNKDLLMAYALIPLTGEDDICRRYLYIQRFRKESKQFGSQRMASEGKAVEMALKNLAINAGYSDTMRLTLRMETKVIDDNRELLEEQTVEGVAFRIQLDPNGKASLTCAKDGKPLKSVPTKLKKHETVLALSQLVKTLTEQYRRTRVMLERAMEDGTSFTFGELLALSAHPVVYPMLKNLVLISKDAVGFLSENGLIDYMKQLRSLSPEVEVKIAHPFDLYQNGSWRGYQKYLFEQKIAQPFRQVFRELYIKTADEIDTYRSLRYAGNQIQPAKTVAALKSRRWVADVEDGLQKVYYKENIVAQIYALADWFSPADIEAPTLEWVCFSDRKTGKEIKIADVPEVVFSEVMRDVDLAVSVAHAGGVDPETSHSTIEMRGAILSFVLPMFRMDNVKVDGRHAIINGKFAEYSVHLGSGVVHQIGGSMIPVLPVHSQHRGKVFLPFVDDDPKTAEIISKVLLFAEDGKIKDPMILAAISK